MAAVTVTKSTPKRALVVKLSLGLSKPVPPPLHPSAPPRLRANPSLPCPAASTPCGRYSVDRTPQEPWGPEPPAPIPPPCPTCSRPAKPEFILSPVEGRPPLS